jgi:hypothetical protein
MFQEAQYKIEQMVFSPTNKDNKDINIIDLKYLFIFVHGTSYFIFILYSFSHWSIIFFLYPLNIVLSKKIHPRFVRVCKENYFKMGQMNEISHDYDKIF